MLDYMRQVLNNPVELSVEERNLLSVAFKNSVGNKRTSWRILDTLEKKEEAKAYTAEVDKHLKQIRTFKGKVEEELNDICNEIIKILDDKLVPSAKDPSSQVFYLKMKGDYYRYIAEYSSPDNKSNVAQNAEKAYKEASKVAEKDLVATDPIKLGLALNYSVFHYEIKNDSK